MLLRLNKCVFIKTSSQRRKGQSIRFPMFDMRLNPNNLTQQGTCGENAIGLALT